jgi:hypothetical protein
MQKPRIILSDSTCNCQRLTPSTPNAGRQLLPEAGARHERTLEAVSSRPLIFIEAPSSAYHRGMLSLGHKHSHEEETSRRFYTTQHPLYCGINLPACPMDVCILRQDVEVVLHRTMPAAPEPFLKAIAPSRDGLVVAVECIFT